MAAPSTASAASSAAFQQAFLEANQQFNAPNPPPSKKVDSIRDKWLKEFHIFHELYEGTKREMTADKLAKTHVEQTRKAILSGADHLNKGQSVVVVLNPTYYGPNDEPVEPLNELLKKCKKLILVSSSEATLSKLKIQLLDSPKVTTIVSDWSGGVYQNIAMVGPKVEEEHDEAAKKDKFAYGMFDALDLSGPGTAASQLLSKIGPEVEKVDYVVSSLVPFDAFTSCIDTADFVYTKNFKGFSATIVDFSNPQISREKGIYFRTWTASKKGRAGDLITKHALANEMGTRLHSMFSSLLSSHMDLMFSLVRPKTGRIYFADTTKVLRKGNNPLMVKVASIYEPHLARMQAVINDKKTNFWAWNYSKSSYKVEYWLWKNVPKNTRFETDKKTAADHKADSKK